MIIRATLVSRTWQEYYDLWVWCREMRIPIVQCEVNVGTTLEPTAIKFQGSRRMVSILTDKLGEVERDLARWQRRNMTVPKNEMIITSGVLLRETDYALVAIKHGIARRSWSWFTRKAIYGDEDD